MTFRILRRLYIINAAALLLLIVVTDQQNLRLCYAALTAFLLFLLLRMMVDTTQRAIRVAHEMGVRRAMQEVTRALEAFHPADVLHNPQVATTGADRDR